MPNRMKTEFVADTDDLEQGAKKAERQIDGVGDAAVRADRRGRGAFRNLRSGIGRAGRAAEGLQSAMGKLLIPVAVVTSVAGLVTQFRDAKREADEFRRRIDEIADSSDRRAESEQRRAREASLGPQSEADAIRRETDDRVRDLFRQARSEQDQIQAEFEQSAESRRRNILRAAAGSLGILEGVSDAERDAASQLDRVSDSLQRSVKAARAAGDAQLEQMRVRQAAADAADASSRAQRLADDAALSAAEARAAVAERENRLMEERIEILSREREAIRRVNAENQKRVALAERIGRAGAGTAGTLAASWKAGRG